MVKWLERILMKAPPTARLVQIAGFIGLGGGILLSAMSYRMARLSTSSPYYKQVKSYVENHTEACEQLGIPVQVGNPKLNYREALEDKVKEKMIRIPVRGAYDHGMLQVTVVPKFDDAKSKPENDEIRWELRMIDLVLVKEGATFRILEPADGDNAAVTEQGEVAKDSAATVEKQKPAVSSTEEKDKKAIPEDSSSAENKKIVSKNS